MGTFTAGPSRVDNDVVWDAGAGLPNVLQDPRTQGGVPAATTYLYGLSLISTTDNAGATSYYPSDGLGSTTAMTNSTSTAG